MNPLIKSTWTLVAGALLVSAANAQSAGEHQVQCKNGAREFSLEIQIRACTGLIQSNQVTGPELAAAHFHRGSAYGRAGNYNGAIADFDQAILLRPNWAHAYFNRARAYGLNKQYERAIADFDWGLKLKPQDANAYYQRGKLLLEIGRTSEGEANLAKAKSIDSTLGASKD